MKKRLLALLLLTGLLSAALTGCGGGSTEQASGDGQTADGSAGARAQTNEIVVGIAQDLDESLDPHKAVAAGTKEVMFNVFEGLVKPTPDGDLIPAVASGYTVSRIRPSIPSLCGRGSCSTTGTRWRWRTSYIPSNAARRFRGHAPDPGAFCDLRHPVG